MALEDPVIIEDFKRVLEKNTQSTFMDYKLILKTEEESLDVLRLDLLKFIRNYIENFKDDVVAMITLTRKEYIESLYPNREILTATLTRELKADDTADANSGSKIITDFNVELLDNIDIEAMAVDSSSTDDDQEDLIEIALSLEVSSSTDVRWATVAGSFRDVSLADLCRLLLKKHTKGVLGVDVVPPVNNVVYPCYLLPQGATKLVDLPGYLQVTDGLYATGCGSYLQNDIWYVFPLWDFTRFDKSLRTLTVVNLPQSDAPTLDSSYYEEDGNVFILSSGESKFKDIGLEVKDNLGEGIRYIRSSAIFDKMFDVSENKVTLNRDKTYKQLSVKERKDKITRALMHPDLITDNPYTELSKIARGQGRLIVVNWARADQSLLYPGMPVKFIYMKKGLPHSVKGTLVAVESTTTTESNSITDNHYLTSCQMTIFAENENEQ